MDNISTCIYTTLRMLPSVPREMYLIPEKMTAVVAWRNIRSMPIHSQHVLRDSNLVVAIEKIDDARIHLICCLQPEETKGMTLILHCKTEERMRSVT